MILGIPRGYFYYDYFLFVTRLFYNSGVKIVFGCENNENVLKKGEELAVDEACIPVKLMAGQLYYLENHCDKIFLPRVMKDRSGRWVCPKLLGLPELMTKIVSYEKYLVTEPLYFNDRKSVAKRLWKACSNTGVKRAVFSESFEAAYDHLSDVFEGKKHRFAQADWEYVPELPGPDEIVLPNTRTVYLAGHCYKVYDKFINMNIMQKLDELGIEIVTEADVPHNNAEYCVNNSKLIKEPFWEAFVRIYGTALHIQDKVDGIIYLSSFSCGLDAFIIDMLKSHITNIPIMVLKLDEHRGEEGYETRIEAFSDLLEKRRMS